MRGIVKSGVYWGADGPVRRGAIDSALEPDLLLVSRCWRGGWRPVASAGPGGSCQAALLGYVTLEHPASITTAGQAIDSIDRLLNHSGRWNKLIRWKTEIAAGGRETPAAGVLDYVVPDGGSTSDTNHIVGHICSIGIARPDSDYNIRSITYRPVVLEIIGCAGFGSHGTIIPILHGKHIITGKLNGPCRVIGEYGGHQESDLLADNPSASRGIIVIKVMAVIIPDIQDALRGDAYALVGKDLVGSYHLQQRDAGCTEGHRGP